MWVRMGAAEDPFVARAVELRRLREWLGSGARLLTIRGPPGVGKSRLAREAFGGEIGAFHGELFGAGDAQAILQRIGGASGAAGIAAALSGAEPRLLVLDNLPLVDAGIRAGIAGLLAQHPALKVVVTAREALEITDEQLLDLGPLALADEAVHLLRLRSAGAGADLAGTSPDALRSIAVALGGLPLALELAAAQLAHLAADQLLERLPARLEVLVRPPSDGAFARHHDLRGAIDASWQRLGHEAQIALAQLSVFRGGFTVEAAEAVLEPGGTPASTLIGTLRDRSLLQLRDAIPQRYGLDESVRIFAARQLAATTRVAAERRHTAWFLEVARPWTQAIEDRADLRAASLLEQEQENLLEVHRRALTGASRSPEGPSDALRAVLALEPLLHLRQDRAGLLELLDAALVAASPSRTEPSLRARTLLARGKARLQGGRPAGALADLQEAAGLARGLADARLEAMVLLRISRAHREQGRDDASLLSCERAIALLEDAGPDQLLGHALGTRGLLAHERGENDDARVWYEKSVDVHLRCGDRRGWAIVTGTLGNLLFDRGQIDEAVQRINEAIAVFHEIGDEQNHAALQATLGAIHQEAGAFDLACREFTAARALLVGSGRRRLEAQIIGSLAGAHLEAGRIDEARRIFHEALPMLREFGDARTEAMILLPLALLLAGEGKLAQADELVDRAEQLLRGVDDPNHLAAVGAARGVVVARQARALGSGPHAVALEKEARRKLESARPGAGATERGRLVLRLLEGALA